MTSRSRANGRAVFWPGVTGTPLKTNGLRPRHPSLDRVRSLRFSSLADSHLLLCVPVGKFSIAVWDSKLFHFYI
jgi:hypothetical protein